MPPAPHYLRFVRAMTLVSVALPVPVVILASQATACGGKVESSSAFTDPNSDHIPTGSGGIQGGPCSDQACGTQALPPDAGHDDDGGEADATDAAPLEEDAADGGGPSRGIPELPRAFSTRLA